MVLQQTCYCKMVNEVMHFFNTHIVKEKKETSIRLSFGKQKRLKSKKWIKLLLTKGKRTWSGPIQAYCLAFPQLPTHQVLIHVPKKYIPSATMRNKIKRRMREVYRLAQEEITPTILGSSYLLAYRFVGSGKEAPSYYTIEKAMKKTTKKLLLHKKEDASQLKNKNY